MYKEKINYAKLKVSIFMFCIVFFINTNIYATENNVNDNILKLPTQYNLADYYNIKVENQGQEGR